MRLYSLNDAPPLGPGLTVRESAFWPILGAVVIFGCTGATVWALLAGHLPPIFWISVAFLVLFATLVLRSLVTAFSIDNWRLHIGEEGIAVKFRTPLNRHLSRDNPVIAVIPWHEIESVHEVKRTVTVRHQPRGQIRTHAYLAFTLRNDAPELAEAILNERTLPPPQGCISVGFVHDAAVMNGARELRIELTSPHTHATPSARKILKAIAPHAPITEAGYEQGEGRLGE